MADQNAQQASDMQAMQQQMAAMQAQQAQAAMGGGGAPDLTTELQKLGDLKAQGLLTDEEFAAAKAKILGT